MQYWLCLLGLSICCSGFAATTKKTSQPDQSKDDIRECLKKDNLGACSRASESLAGSESPELIPIHEKLCEQGSHRSSCRFLVDASVKTEDSKSTLHWLRKLCDIPEDRGLACFQIAQLAKEQGSKTNAATWSKKACQRGHKPSCGN